MLVLAQARHLSPQGCSTLTDREPKDFAVYKPYLCYLAMVDGLYDIMFKANTSFNFYGYFYRLAVHG